MRRARHGGGERGEERVNSCNGHRRRERDNRAGAVELANPETDRDLDRHTKVVPAWDASGTGDDGRSVRRTGTPFRRQV
jgi:hypothetical protein